MSQLNIKKPIVAIGGLWTGFEQQELLVRLLPQQAMLQTELIVRDLDLLYFRQVNRVKICEQRFLFVVPKDNAMLLEQSFQGDLDSRFWILD